MSEPRIYHSRGFLVIFHLYLSFLVDVELEHIYFVWNLIIVRDSSWNYHKLVEPTVTCHRIVLEVTETNKSFVLKLGIGDSLVLNLIIHASI
jgi:hypothetical protein